LRKEDIKMLNIGFIDFLNTLPFNVEKAGIKTNFSYKLIKDVPAQLNKLLREGKIDVGIVSAAEYIENFENYLILPDLSISAKGKVFSVSVFSNIPINEIKEIYLTKASKSSRYLTKTIFEKFLKKEIIYHELESFENIQEKTVLLIGDNAILMKNKFKYAYDLSEIWYKKTKLPFVFAMWVVRKDSFKVKKEEIIGLYNTLKKTKEFIFDNLDKFLTDKKINSEFAEFYLRNLDYSLTQEHLESLNLFSDYLYELKIINKKPVFNFITF
jgi:chorismate dehydratase